VLNSLVHDLEEMMTTFSILKSLDEKNVHDSDFADIDHYHNNTRIIVEALKKNFIEINKLLWEQVPEFDKVPF
jgi:hypothetical protein